MPPSLVLNILIPLPFISRLPGSSDARGVRAQEIHLRVVAGPHHREARPNLKGVLSPSSSV
jgi:hypothetical protein